MTSLKSENSLSKAEALFCWLSCQAKLPHQFHWFGFSPLSCFSGWRKTCLCTWLSLFATPDSASPRSSAGASSHWHLWQKIKYGFGKTHSLLSHRRLNKTQNGLLENLQITEILSRISLTVKQQQQKNTYKDCDMRLFKKKNVTKDCLLLKSVFCLANPLLKPSF